MRQNFAALAAPESEICRHRPPGTGGSKADKNTRVVLIPRRMGVPCMTTLEAKREMAHQAVIAWRAQIIPMMEPIAASGEHSWMLINILYTPRIFAISRMPSAQ